MPLFDEYEDPASINVDPSSYMNEKVQIRMHDNRVSFARVSNGWHMQYVI